MSLRILHYIRVSFPLNIDRSCGRVPNDDASYSSDDDSETRERGEGGMHEHPTALAGAPTPPSQETERGGGGGGESCDHVTHQARSAPSLRALPAAGAVTTGGGQQGWGRDNDFCPSPASLLPE